MIAQREMRARLEEVTQGPQCAGTGSQLCTSPELPSSDFVGSLKWAILGVFTPQKSANVPDQGLFLDLGMWLLNIHQDTTGVEKCLCLPDEGSGESFQPERAA